MISPPVGGWVTTTTSWFVIASPDA
jgi:hypothetical protein